MKINGDYSYIPEYVQLYEPPAAQSPKKRKIEKVEPNYGNEWLIKLVGQTAEADPFTKYYARVVTSCKERFSPDEEWNLQQLFPERTLSEEQVARMSVKEILSLPPENFFAIIDLISSRQAFEILIPASNKYENYKYALYVFNPNLRKEIVRKHKTCWELPIDKRVREQAENAWEKYRRKPEILTTLETLPNYERWENFRLKLSDTLKKERGEAISQWKKVNKLYQTLDFPVTEEFLEKISSELVARDNIYAPPESRNTGLRSTGREVPKLDQETYYFPGSCVKQELKLFLAWLNAKILLCDQGKDNPLVLAAFAAQRFITIHPCTDGNGRTGRILTDLILKRYGVLPAIWPDTIYFVSSKNDEVTSTEALEKLLNGLSFSYTFIDCPLEPKKREGKQEK